MRAVDLARRARSAGRSHVLRRVISRAPSTIGATVAARDRHTRQTATIRTVPVVGAVNADDGEVYVLDITGDSIWTSTPVSSGSTTLSSIAALGSPLRCACRPGAAPTAKLGPAASSPRTVIATDFHQDGSTSISTRERRRSARADDGVSASAARRIDVADRRARAGGPGLPVLAASPRSSRSIAVTAAPALKAGGGR